MGNALSSALRLLGLTLYWIGLAPFVRWLTRRQPKVLLYHACLPEEDHFVRGLESNTTPAQLTMHLESLRGRYRIIPLSQLEAGAVPDHAVVITFDDGYRSVHDFAMPILRAHQAPATVYLISDVMDKASLVWVNELMWFLHVHADVTEPIVRRVLQRPSGESPAELVSHARATYDPAMIAALLGELRLAVGDGGAALAARAVPVHRRHGAGPLDVHPVAGVSSSVIDM